MHLFQGRAELMVHLLTKKTERVKTNMAEPLIC